MDGAPRVSWFLGRQRRRGTKNKQPRISPLPAVGRDDSAWVGGVISHPFHDKAAEWMGVPGVSVGSGGDPAVFEWSVFELVQEFPTGFEVGGEGLNLPLALTSRRRLHHDKRRAEEAPAETDASAPRLR